MKLQVFEGRYKGKHYQYVYETLCLCYLKHAEISYVIKNKQIYGMLCDTL